MTVFMSQGNDLVAQLIRGVIGCQDSNSNWLVIVSFDPSVCRVSFVCL